MGRDGSEETHGYGGIAAVVRATGLQMRPSVGASKSPQRVIPPAAGRVHRGDGGRKATLEREPGLKDALLALLDGATAGDPCLPLRWTTLTLST